MSKYARLNLYLKPELYDATDVTVLLEKNPVSVGDWIRRQMQAGFSFKDLDKHREKARKKLQAMVRDLEGKGYVEEIAIEKLSDLYGIPVGRLKILLNG